MISAVIGRYKEYPCSAGVLETILDKKVKSGPI
jgi:hypothetical protein